MEGATIPVTIEATDDAAVVSVDFLVNGQVVSTGLNRFTLKVPEGVTMLTLGARAIDPGGNVGTAADVVINVVPDSEPPLVSITSPVPGDPVTEGATLPITVEATDEVAVVSVDFLVNGQVVFTTTTALYQFDFTVPVGATSLTVGARATDPAGNVGTATDVMVNVVRDTTAPTVEVTTPAPGSTIRERSQQEVFVEATDDVAITLVELLVNGQVVETTTTAPAQFTFTVPIGATTLTLVARASDAAGNVGVATDVIVNVIPDLPPTVRITVPTAGVTAFERTTLRIAVDATDDVAVTGVELLVNGQVIGSASFPPYRFKVQVPSGVTTLTLGARATDVLGQNSTAPDVVVNVMPDPGTTAVGRVLDSDGNPVAGATVVCLGVSGFTAADGTFLLTSIPTLQGEVQCVATAIINGQNMGGGSPAVPPVQGGTSIMGDIVLAGATDAPLYTAGIRLPLSFNAFAIAVGDLDRDEKSDLAAANGSSVSVFLGSGDGAFQPEHRFAVGNSPRSVAIVDLNRDNNPDLVTANNLSTDVSVLLGNGDGSFQTQRRFSTGGSDAEEAAVGDVNGDEIPDLVTANIRDRRFFPGDGDVTVFLGNGDGSFQPPQFFNTGGNPAAVVMADLDVDGVLDFAVADAGGDAVWIFMGNGDGTFEPQQTMAAGDGATALAVTDVNEDGKLDLITANRLSGDMSVLLGNGDGTFQPQQRVAVGSRPTAVVAADINFDGKIDLAVADEAANKVVMLLGAGDGAFPTQQQVAASNGPTALAVGDLNGDHLLDLVTANTLSKDVLVLFHR